MAKVFNFDNPQEITDKQKQFIEKLSGLEEYFINFFGQEYADVIRKKLDEVLCVFVSKGHFDINLTQYKQYFEKILLDKFCGSVKISNNFKNVDDLLNVIKSTLSAENLTELNDETYNALFDDFGYSKMFKDKTEFLEYLKNQENFDEVKNRAFLLNETFRMEYLPIAKTINTYTYTLLNSYFAEKSILEQFPNHNFLTFYQELLKNILNESNFFDAQFDNLDDIKTLLEQNLDNFEDKYVIVNKDAILALFQNDDSVKDKINKDMTLDELLSNKHIKSKLKAFQSYYKTIISIADSTISETESKFNLSNNNMNELARVIAERKQSIDISQIISMINTLNYGLAFVNNQSPATAYAHTNLQFTFCDTNAANITIVHELIHIISNNLFTQKAPGFNEVLTEVFAKIINAQMSKANFYVGENKKFVSSYNACVNLLSDFLSENKEILIKSYMGESLEPIISLVGEKNLEELNAICEEIFKISLSDSDFSYWKALNNNKECSFDISNQNLLDRLKNVMDKVHQHMQNNDNSLE